MAENQIAKVSPVHQRLAEWLIANGTKKGWNKAAADHFGYSQAWISTIIHSDAFQDYFSRLSGAHSEALLLGVREKATAAADSAISEVQRRLEAAPEQVPFKDLLETTETMRKFTGAGEKRTAPTAQVTNNFILSKEDLEDARKRMRERASPKGIIDLTANEAS